MRRYLTAHGDLPQQSLVAALPIALRAKDDMSAGGDRSTTELVALHTEVSDDVDRLVSISAATDHIAAMHTGARPDHLSAVAEVAPGRPLGTCLRSTAEWAARRRSSVAANTTGVCSPGPRVPLYLLGREVVGWLGIGSVLDDIRLAHVVTSYRDAFAISVIVDVAAMSDIEFYITCLRDAFAGMSYRAESFATQ